MHISCKPCTKYEAFNFFPRHKILQEFCKNKLCKIIFLQDVIKILQENNIEIFLQDSCKFLNLARKDSFVVQDLQDLVQDLARKMPARFAYFLQLEGLYWEVNKTDIAIAILYLLETQ